MASFHVETHDGKKVAFEAPEGASPSDIEALASQALKAAIPHMDYGAAMMPGEERAKYVATIPLTQDEILARQGNLQAPGEMRLTDQLVDETGDAFASVFGNGGRRFGKRLGNFLNDMTPAGAVTYGGDGIHDVASGFKRGDAGLMLAGGLGVLGSVAGVGGMPERAAARRGLSEIIGDQAGKFSGEATTAFPSSTAKATARQLASMPGAPSKPISTRKVGQLSEDYLRQVDQGKMGADWYQQSGRSIMEHFGENQPAAVKFTGAVGVTSSQTPVLSNLEHAVRGHNQFNMGDPVKTGMFPTAMGKDITGIYNGPEMSVADLAATTDEPFGRKRTPFIRQNLMYENQDMSSARAVHDIWDARARGYANPDGSPFSGTFPPTAHRWADLQDQGYLIPEANARQIGGRADWDTGRLQASAWVGNKIDSEMGKGKTFDAARDLAITDYSHGWDRLYANHSWESAPGSNTGHMTGFDKLPWDARSDYHDQAKSAFLNDEGQSRIALGYGAPTGKSYDTTGLYEGVMSPGTQDQIAVARAGGSQAIDPSSAKTMDAVAATQGVLGGQKGAAWNYLSPANSTKAGMSAVDFNIGRTLTPEDIDQFGPMIQDAFPAGNVGLLPSPNGMRLTKFWDEPGADMKAFLPDFEKAVGAKGRPTTYSGNYMENQWDQPSGRFGGDYLGVLQGVGMPDMAQRFDSFAPDIARRMANDIDPQMIKDAGLTGSADMDRLRKTIANEGWNGFVKLVESTKGSASAKSALIAAVAGLGGAGALSSEAQR